MMHPLTKARDDRSARVSVLSAPAFADSGPGLLAVQLAPHFHMDAHLLHEQLELLLAQHFLELGDGLDAVPDQRVVRGEHHEIMEAALRRDQDATFQALERHLLATAQIILRSPLLDAG